MELQELICLVAEETLYTRREIRSILTVFSRQLFRALADGRDVHLHGLGWFYNYLAAPRSGRNPITGERVRIPARRRLKFIPTKELKMRVRDSAKLYEEESLSQRFGLTKKEDANGKVRSRDRSEEGAQGEEGGRRREGSTPEQQRPARSRPWYRAIRKET